MNRKLITRADDFGSAGAANRAILQAVERGYLVRNVSCMAPGPCLDRDAPALAALAHRVDIGLHLTVNAEWDPVKWGPCAPAATVPALLDAGGVFYPSGEALAAAAPPVEQLLREADAQLDRLTALGLPVSYLDGHMFPDRFVPGLGEALRGWCRQKGLRYASDLDPLYAGGPAFAPSYEEFSAHCTAWARALTAPITLYIIHPAQYSPETRAFCNGRFPAGVVAWERELEYRSATDPVWCQRARELDLTPVRFREID